jgi:hypothetical protein
MGELSLLMKIRELIGCIGWKLFLWGLGATKEQYWDVIFNQELQRRVDTIKSTTEVLDG